MQSLTDPAKIISIMRVMLSELERSLSEAPQPMQEDDDSRCDHLKGQIDRLDTVLKKHQKAEHRRKEIDRENKRNR